MHKALREDGGLFLWPVLKNHNSLNINVKPSYSFLTFNTKLQHMNKAITKLPVSRLFYFLGVIILMTSCAEKPFEGKISYEAEFKTGLGETFGFADAMLGQFTNSTLDLYVKEGKVMIITEPNNKVFGTFQGSFTKLIWDLDNQEAFVVNDKDKTYTRESLLDSDIEGFSFEAMKDQIDSAKAHLITPSGDMEIGNYTCKTYELDGSLIKGKVALNYELMQEMKPTITKIEGMQDYDLTEVGFPLYYEQKLFGTTGFVVRASRVEKKELDASIFSLDGYREINQLEFYKQNFDNLDFASIGLGDEVAALKGTVDSLSSEFTEGINNQIDSLARKIDVGGMLNELDHFLKGGDTKEDR